MANAAPRRRPVFGTFVVSTAAIGGVLTACIGDPPGSYELPPGPGDELWAQCELPKTAVISYTNLNPGLIEDGGPQDRTCGRTRLRYGKTGCAAPTISIDESAECHGDYSKCCTLIHEAVHVKQMQKLCALCGAKGDAESGAAFDDECVDCWLEYCDIEKEIDAYHVECQVQSACAPGQTGKGGQPPPPDADIRDEDDRGLACFGEWFQCLKLLSKTRELPAACHGVVPDCGRMIDMANVQCGCGTTADRTYGCRLDCPDGKTCASDPATGGCSCR